MICIASITLVHLDLNLLTALDALLEEGSVGAAAQRLHLSQPAMSRTLTRIRRTTGDQILVRSGRAMLPTPYALAIRAEVHGLVDRAHGVLSPRHHLDLSSLERTFVLRCHDAVTTTLAPELISTVRAEAPGVRLRFLAEPSGDSDDLRRGHGDVEIGSAEPATSELRSELLGHEGLLVGLRSTNPLHAGELTVQRYASAEHITVSRRGRLHDPVDDALAQLGLSRRVVASTPTIAAALRIVSGSDLVVALPATICRWETSTLKLATAPLPVSVPPVKVVLSWHRRYDDDAAHAWLRGLIRAALTAVTGDTPIPG